jgi:hypothetical protein
MRELAPTVGVLASLAYTAETCLRCGYMSSNDICKACALLQGLESGLDRSALVCCAMGACERSWTGLIVAASVSGQRRSGTGRASDNTQVRAASRLGPNGGGGDRETVEGSGDLVAWAIALALLVTIWCIFCIEYR